MVTLKCKAGRVVLTVPAKLGVSKELREQLQLAVFNYSYVNNCLGVNWKVSIQQWIRNINAVYDIQTPQVKAIVQALNELDALALNTV